MLGREEGLDQGDAARAGRHDPVREADVVLEYLMLYVHVIHMHMHMHMHMHKHGRAGPTRMLPAIHIIFLEDLVNVGP